MVTSRAPDPVEALDRGGAFVVLEDARVTSVRGRDARTWLHDLVTTDVASLELGVARPSLLLTPTGRIRAQFAVGCVGEDAFVLIQREPVGNDIATALGPYVLSSDVELALAPTRVLSLPGAGEDPLPVPTTTRPSVLGGGADLLVDDVDEAGAALERAGRSRAPLGTAERRRVARGEPRFPIDLDADSLPAEAGLDGPPTTDRTKGCFLGQEAIAKVANLGHPTRVVLAVQAPEPVRAGEAVLAAGVPVGVVTSADGGRALVRVAWASRDQELGTAGGATLTRR